MDGPGPARALGRAVHRHALQTAQDGTPQVLNHLKPGPLTENLRALTYRARAPSAFAHRLKVPFVQSPDTGPWLVPEQLKYSG